MRVAFAALIAALALVALDRSAAAHDAAMHETHAAERDPLSVLGPAPDFSLISQDGMRVSLHDYRGKVLAIAFIYTYCPDVCPMLTANMAQIQQELGSDFGKSVAFVSITVDPERDTPQVLKDYADNFGADLGGWAFLTGPPAEVREVGRRYGIFAAKSANGEINHTLLTSIVDGDGRLRVQYIGARFDLEEFRSDLLSLLGKSK
jgi:protein SCO1